MALSPHLMLHDRQVIETYLTHALPFFVEGGPGIGKSLAVSTLGRQVYQQRCRSAEHGTEHPGCCCEPIKIDITEDTEVRHLLGEIDVVRYMNEARNNSGATEMRDFFRAGPLVHAMQTGRLLIIEELDRAGRETLFPVLFDALEKKETYVPELGAAAGRVVGLPGFNIVITVNRSTDIGTVRLPTALLRRLRRVTLYDPSRVGLDLLDRIEAAVLNHDPTLLDAQVDAADLDRAQAQFIALVFEEQLIHQNLQAAGYAPADTPTRRRLTEIVLMIAQMRAELRRADALDLGDEQITPAESARYLLDLALCEQLTSTLTEPFALHAALVRHLGALAKSEAQSRVLRLLIDRLYLDRRLMFAGLAE